jgi:hypothetical protein
MQENHNLQSGCAEGIAKTAVSAEKEVVRWLLLLASAKKVRRQFFLKFFYLNVLVEAKRAAVWSLSEAETLLSTVMFFV